MSWLRLDDKFAQHPKFEGWPAAMRWAFVELMLYCARYKTGGRIPTDRSLLPRKARENLIEKAKESGWIDVRNDGSEWIHDFEFYNPKDPTGAARQAKYREARNGSVTDNVTDEVTPTRAGERARPVPLRGTDGSGTTPSGSTKSSAGGRRDDEQTEYRPELAEALVRNGWWDDPRLADSLVERFANIPAGEVDRLCALAGELAAP